MNWRKLFYVHPNTANLWQVCFNLVARTVIVALAWTCLLGIGFLLNLWISLVLSALGTNDTVKNVLSQLVLFSVTMAGVAATITGVADAVALTIAAIRSSTTPNSHQGGSEDDKQKSDFG